MRPAIATISTACARRCHAPWRRRQSSFSRDRLGGLALTFEGLRARDRQVFQAARAAGAAVAVVLAGGYAADVEDTVEAHVSTVIEALEASSPG